MASAASRCRYRSRPSKAVQRPSGPWTWLPRPDGCATAGHPGRPVVEADRQDPRPDTLDTAMAAAGAQVSVQVADRPAIASMMGRQHGSSGGRIAQAVEDRDALGRAQHHIEGRHRAPTVGVGRGVIGVGVAALEHGLEPGHRCCPAAPGCWRRRRTTGLGTHRGRTDTARGQWPAPGCNTSSRPTDSLAMSATTPPPPPRRRWRQRTHPWCIAS